MKMIIRSWHRIILLKNKPQQNNFIVKFKTHIFNFVCSGNDVGINRFDFINENIKQFERKWKYICLKYHMHTLEQPSTHGCNNKDS